MNSKKKKVRSEVDTVAIVSKTAPLMLHLLKTVGG